MFCLTHTVSPTLSPDALYHFFVLIAVLPAPLGVRWWGAAVATVALVIAGEILTFVYRVHGLLLAWALHAVADGWIMWMLVAIYYREWVPSRCGA